MNNTLTGHKDTEALVLSKLEDRDLLSYFRTGLGTKIYNDENFWRNRTFNKYGRVKKSKNQTWRDYYLNKMLLYGQQLDQSVYDAVRANNREEIVRLLNMGADLQYALDGALYIRNKELVDFIKYNLHFRNGHWTTIN